MADITFPGLDPELLAIFDEIDRNMPEVRTIEDVRRLAHESQERFRGQIFPDSTDLIREDRER